MKINFGKYDGKDVKDLEEPYLVWLLTRVPDLEDGLRAACRARLGLPDRPEPWRAQAVSDEDRATILRRWKRRMLVDYPANVVDVGLGVLKNVLDGLG